jgi:hypothetical protein
MMYTFYFAMYSRLNYLKLKCTVYRLIGIVDDSNVIVGTTFSSKVDSVQYYSKVDIIMYSL